MLNGAFINYAYVITPGENGLYHHHDMQHRRSDVGGAVKKLLRSQFIHKVPVNPNSSIHRINYILVIL